MCLEIFTGKPEVPLTPENENSIVKLGSVYNETTAQDYLNTITSILPTRL